MQIFQIKPEFKRDGSNKFRHLIIDTPTPAKFDDMAAAVQQSFRNRNDLAVRWADDTWKLPDSDFVPISYPILVFSEKAADSISPLISDQIIIAKEKAGAKFAAIKPANRENPVSGLPHVFLMRDRFKMFCVTQKFKDRWEHANFTGAAFELVGELPDGLFAQVP